MFFFFFWGGGGVPIASPAAKRVGELQALSHRVAFSGSNLSLSHLPEFVEKTESICNPLPWSFLVKSLEDSVGDMPEERYHCPVRAVRVNLERTSSFSPCPLSLFVSPSNPSRPMSKNALLFFLRRIILDAGAVADFSIPRAHSVQGVTTSASFLRNWSVSKVLGAAFWQSNTVFASFYLKDLSFCLDGCSSLGPFVAAGSVLS